MLLDRVVGIFFITIVAGFSGFSVAGSMLEKQKEVCYMGKELGSGYASLRQQGYSKEYIFEYIENSQQNKTTMNFAKQIATNVYNYNGDLNVFGDKFYMSCLKEIGVL